MSLVECILHEEKKMEDTADAKCKKGRPRNLTPNCIGPVESCQCLFLGLP